MKTTAIFITGDPQSGKTMLAKFICAGKDPKIMRVMDGIGRSQIEKVNNILRGIFEGHVIVVSHELTSSDFDCGNFENIVNIKCEINSNFIKF